LQSTIINSIVIEPCFIGDNVTLINSVVGPHVSLGKGTNVENSVIRNSIVQNNSKIVWANIANSMIGNSAEVHGRAMDLSVGDFNVYS
jgi:glucose-1-phosphate thymidylyltransferase